MTEPAAIPTGGAGCLDSAALERLAAGEPPAPEESAHLASCDRCQTAHRLAIDDHALLASLARAAAAPPTPGSGPARPPAPAAGILVSGTRLADFTIQGVLGRGGMGVVYAAEQDSPRRTVALKLVHSDDASDESLRRFEHESAALAALSHPGIAQVYSAGVAAPIEPGRQEPGRPRPYMAMELISGKPLEAFAEEAGLGLAARLRLVIRVCDAVDHAHRRGVIHRDLKPSNILVREGTDGSARPTIVDFGVAKLRGPAGGVPGAQADLTHAGAFVGTLAFASPEQVGGDAGAVDARTDVYALGVVLYRLVTGRHPYDLGGSLADAVRTIAEARIVPPRKAGAPVDDELALVIVTALAADPERRYRSAAALGDDLQRYLECRPLIARGDSTRYVLRKAIARHKFRTAAAGLALVSFVAAGITVNVLRGQARSAEQAHGRVFRAWLGSLNRSNEEDPTTDRLETIGDFLREADKAVDQELKDYPAERAQVLWELGRANLGHQRLDAAVEQLGSVVAFRKTNADPAAYADALIQLGRAHEKLGAFETALSKFEEAWSVRKLALGADHPETVAVRYYLGTALNGWKRYTEATDHFRIVAEMQARTAPDTLEHGKYLNALAASLRGEGKFEEALEIAHQSLEVIERVEGKDSKGAAFAISNIAANLISLQRLDEAFPLLERGLALRAHHFGEEDARVASALVQLAMLKDRRAETLEAEPSRKLCEEAAGHARRALELRRTVHKGDHELVAEALSLLGRATMHAGRPQEAHAALADALEMRRRMPRPHDGDLGVSESLMGECLTLEGEFAEAEPLLRSGLDRLRAAYGDSAARTEEARKRLNLLLLRTGRGAEAGALGPGTR